MFICLDFTSSLGLPGFDKLKQIFNFNLNDLTLGQALDYLDDFKLSSLKEKIIKLLEKVEVMCELFDVILITVKHWLFLKQVARYYCIKLIVIITLCFINYGLNLLIYFFVFCMSLICFRKGSKLFHLVYILHNPLLMLPLAFFGFELLFY